VPVTSGTVTWETTGKAIEAINVEGVFFGDAKPGFCAPGGKTLKTKAGGVVGGLGR